MAGAELFDIVASNLSAECGKHVVSAPDSHLRLLFALSYPNTLYRSINSVLNLAPTSSVQILSVSVISYCLQYISTNKKKLHGLSPRANYTDRAAAAGRRN